MTDTKDIEAVEAQLKELQVQQAKEEAKLMDLRVKQAEKLAKRKIGAKEAREIADASTKYLSLIYKSIREEAEDGRVRLLWTVEDVSKVCIDNIVNALKADGYTVEYSDSTIDVRW